MVTWAPLQHKLGAAETLTLSWAELELLVGTLPPSAYKYAAYWAGHKAVWAGFHAVDVHVGQSVTFVRDHSAPIAGIPVPTGSVDHRPSTPIHHVPRNADIVLIGCVKKKLDHAAPAKDLYISDLFHKERAYAEASGARWFILSAKYGLVDPDQVIDTYQCALADTTHAYQVEWGSRVVADLTKAMGPLTGTRVEIHAGKPYVSAIYDLLTGVGAVVVEPLAGLPFGKKLAWYKALAASTAEVAAPSETGVSSYVAALRNESLALTPAQFLATGGVGLKSPGLYSWWVDVSGAHDLTHGLGHAVRPGLIYAGLAGATHVKKGTPSKNTLWLRISGMHLASNQTFSTLRLTLGSVLAEGLRWTTIDEAQLTTWMHAHLRVIAVPVTDADTLSNVETAVLHQLDPPLNLAKVPKTALRRTLSARRKKHGS